MGQKKGKGTSPWPGLQAVQRDLTRKAGGTVPPNPKEVYSQKKSENEAAKRRWTQEEERTEGGGLNRDVTALETFPAPWEKFQKAGAP